MASPPVIFTLGKYEVMGLLGQGGIAMVYKGYHRDIDRYLAIKVLHPHLRLDPQFIERFKLEARVIARLQHPHIVPLYDWGNQDDVWFLATAYIQGGSLAEVIAKGPIPLSRIDKMLREIASALDYAHRNGVIHRDIKPSNILLDTEGHGLLADFGIVKIAGTGTTLTGTGDIIGTPAYIAPEQAQAMPVDKRADIYSLGAVVFEMLTGQPPFRGRTPVEALILQINAPAPRVTHLRKDIPPALDDVLQRVMAKNPDERYQSAVEFYEDFSRATHSDVSFVQIKEGLRPQLETVEHPLVHLPDEAPGSLTTIILEDTPKRRQLPRSLKLAALAAVVALTVILGRGIFGHSTTVGSLNFSTGNIAGDTAQLEVQALPSPRAGQHYVAWLQNTGDGTTAILGPLTLDDSGTGSVTYTDPDGRILLSQFNAIIITQQEDDTTANTGAVRYSGQLSNTLSAALAEILFKTDAMPAEATTNTASYGPATQPLNSLLDGAFAEALIGQQHSGLAADAPNVGAMHLHAEHTINIYLGTRDDYNGNGRGENPGHKIGVPFFLDHFETLLTPLLSAPDTPARVQTEIQGIFVCDQNIRNWLNQIIGFEHDLLDANDITSVEPQKMEATQLATYLLEGVDANQNGQIEPMEGECGLQQIQAYAQQAASVTIVEGS